MISCRYLDTPPCVLHLGSQQTCIAPKDPKTLERPSKPRFSVRSIAECTPKTHKLPSNTSLLEGAQQFSTQFGKQVVWTVVKLEPGLHALNGLSHMRFVSAIALHIKCLTSHGTRHQLQTRSTDPKCSDARCKHSKQLAVAAFWAGVVPEAPRNYKASKYAAPSDGAASPRHPHHL